LNSAQPSYLVLHVDTRENPEGKNRVMIVRDLEDLRLLSSVCFLDLFDHMSYRMLEFCAWISLNFFPIDIMFGCYMSIFANIG
jgi:hypothetical protein